MARIYFQKKVALCSDPEAKVERAKPDVSANKVPCPPGTETGPLRPHPAAETIVLSRGEALARTPSPIERRCTL